LTQDLSRLARGVEDALCIGQQHLAFFIGEWMGAGACLNSCVFEPYFPKEGMSWRSRKRLSTIC
jgi:hypothetical protein